MGKHIAKFEAVGTFNLHELLKSYNLTVVDLNNMAKKLEEYRLEPDLRDELKVTRDRDYRDLRKWKLDSFLSRYEKAKEKIEKAELIEDYLLELTDIGYRVKLNITGNTFIVYTKGVNKSRLDRIAEVSNFLQHLDNTHRINIELLSIEDSNEFRVGFSFEGDEKRGPQDEDYEERDL